MHVFVAGATGVLGRALIPRLIASGHKVTGLARSPERLLLVDRLGASPVRGDILDDNTMRRLLTEGRPDAIVNVATSIPLRLKVEPRDWEQNDHIRVDGTRGLLRAAEAAAVKLFIQESVGYVCSPAGDSWITETSPRSTHPFLKATVEMEDMVRAARVPTVLLRFGALMCSESWHTQQSIAALRRGMLPIIGDGSSYLSLIHALDGAAAIAIALERGETAAGKTYNVVDKAPAPMREVLAYAAERLGAPRPKNVPAFLAKLVAGSVTVDVLTASYRMSSQKIQNELDFKPRFPTYRETWTEIAKDLRGQEIVASSDLQ